MMDIGSHLARNARQQPHEVSLIYKDKQLTYDEVNRLVNRLAHGLLNLGVKKGDKIAMMMKNSEYFPVTYFAIIKIGGVVVPINGMLTANEVAYIVDHSDAKFVIYDDIFGPIVEKARSDKVQHLIALGEPKVDGHLPYNEVMTNNEAEPGIQVELSDNIDILYTSGTTGKPKGVVFDHFRVMMALVYGMPFGSTYKNNCAIHIAPFFHSAPLRGMIRAIFMGMKSVIHDDFDPVETLKSIEKYKVTSFFGVPTMYNMLLQVPDKEKYDLSSVQTCGYGAAPMAPEIVKQSMDLFGTDQFYNQCGLTEGGPGGIILTPEEHEYKMGASGKSRFITEARVVDANGNDVAPGDIGELIIKGPSLMKEYYKNPEATKEALRDGWLYTGDLCQIDEDGFITLVDRKKDMIISGGVNVYSVEVEQILYACPGVLEAAVIGTPDDKWGELVTAVVVKKPNETLTAEDVQAFCREHLASYKVPRAVHFIDILPRNATGKVLKYQLREQLSKVSS